MIPMPSSVFNLLADRAYEEAVARRKQAEKKDEKPKDPKDQARHKKPKP